MRHVLPPSSSSSAVLVAVSLLSAAVAWSPCAAAKDLGNRVGVGVQTQLGTVPTVSVRYGVPMPNPAINIQVEGDFGLVSAQSTPRQLVLGGRALYAVVVEDNLNLYAYGGVAYLDEGGASTLRLQPGLEVQAFPFGLENLGLTTGLGANIDLGGGQTGLSTLGSVLAGFHYWF